MIELSQPWPEAHFFHPYIKDNSNEATMVVWEGAKRLGQKKD